MGDFNTKKWLPLKAYFLLYSHIFKVGKYFLGQLFLSKLYFRYVAILCTFFFYINLFILFYLAVLGLHCCARAFSSAASGGYSSLWCAGFSLRWLLLLWSTGSRCAGFSSCGTHAQQLWCMGLGAPWQVGSSRIRDRTCVPCIGRRILNHCDTREVSCVHFNSCQI